jgi:purine-binding chemotaxis protein CheW
VYFAGLVGLPQSGKRGELVMNSLIRLLVFVLDEQHYALHLDAVKRVVRMVEITPLPKSPEIVLGMVNIQGRVIPVLNIRKRFRLAERQASLNDHLIIAHTSNHDVALTADAVTGVIERSEHEVVLAQEILSRMEYVEGVVKLEGGLILIHNLDRFLSLDEETKLHSAMEETSKGSNRKAEGFG